MYSIQLNILWIVIFHLITSSKYTFAVQAPEVSNQQVQVSNQQEQVSNQQEQVSNQQAQVSNQQEQVSNQQEQVSNQQEQVSNQQEQVSNQQEQVSNQQEQLSDQQPQVSNHEFDPDLSLIEFTSQDFRGKQYLLSKDIHLADITDFQDNCRAAGGYLAEIDTEAEYDFIMTFLKEELPSRRRTALVGATDQETEGSWVMMESGKPAGFLTWCSFCGRRGPGRDCLYLVWNSRDAGMHDWLCFLAKSGDLCLRWNQVNRNTSIL